MAPGIHLVIGNTDPAFRSGLRDIIGTDRSLLIAGEATDGATALSLAEELLPTVLIVEYEMGRKNGLRIAKEVKRLDLPVKIIMLTRNKEEHMFNTLLDYGVNGYIAAESAATELLPAIRAVAAGRTFVSPPYAEFLSRRERQASALRRLKPSIDQLTPTERKVLLRIADSKTTRQIAEELHISAKTVENHRANIAQKLNLHGSHSVLKFAIENRSIL